MSVKPAFFHINSINKNIYYNSKELYEYNPEFYEGCNNENDENIISIKNIPESEYIFAHLLKSGDWEIASSQYRNAILLLSKKWVDKNFFKIDTLETNSEELEDAEESDYDNIEEIEEVPAILDFEDSERFKDCDGNIFEIETRGERNKNKIYFKVKDVMKAFDISNLNQIIVNSGQYKLDTHYKIFVIHIRQINSFIDIDRHKSLHNKSSKNRIFKKEQFLTYKGLLKVIFTFNSNKIEAFQDWIEERLFSLQLGSVEEKIELGTSILGITSQTYKDVFETYTSKFPCIYLLSLGKSEKIKNMFTIIGPIEDDTIIYKYGFTGNLDKTLEQHSLNYGNMGIINLNLIIFYYIDPKFVNEAEGKIRDFCSVFENKLTIEGECDLMGLNGVELSFVKDYYSFIGVRYAGLSIELQSEIRRLDLKISKLQTEAEVIKLQYENEFLKFQYLTNDSITELQKQNYDLHMELHSKKPTQS